jgi:hypothetical protein
MDDLNNHYISNNVIHIHKNYNTSNTFAIIPIKNSVHTITRSTTTTTPVVPVPADPTTTITNTFNRSYIDYNPSNSSYPFERTYFGPVNISQLKVRLLDDKGNIVNLNKHDWSFSLLVEQIYNPNS